MHSFFFRFIRPCPILIHLNHPEILRTCLSHLTIPQFNINGFKHRPITWFAFKGPKFSLVLTRNVRCKETVVEEEA